MTLFADTFRATQVPRLRRLIDCQALLIALDMEGFSGAFSAVHTAAIAAGAGHLPANKYQELLDWIATAILAAEAAHRTRRETSPVFTGVEQWNRRVLGWAAGAR